MILFPVIKRPFFFKSDRLKKLIGKKFHMIVSNPPYIKSKQDKKKVHPQVDRWEPDTALYLDDDIYEGWFEELFDQVFRSLYRGGAFLMGGP